MNEFDLKAAGWDDNPMHWERSEAIAAEIKKIIPLRPGFRGLEYGAGTGILSFLLKDRMEHIVLMDSSSGMINMIEQRIEKNKISNFEARHFDLEHSELNGEKFDFIYTQMVLHHVMDIDGILQKFSNLLNPGGFLAIADLYEEDGTFHGEGFTGHKGFNIEKLSAQLTTNFLGNINYKTCFTVNRKISETETRQFDIFLLTASKR